MKCLTLAKAPPEPRTVWRRGRESKRGGERKRREKLRSKDTVLEHCPLSQATETLRFCLITFIPLSLKSTHSSRPIDFSFKRIL